ACKHQLLPCRRLAGLTPLPPHHSNTNTKHSHTNAHGRTPRCNITHTWTHTHTTHMQVHTRNTNTHTHTQMHMDILNASLQTSRWTNTEINNFPRKYKNFL